MLSYSKFTVLNGIPPKIKISFLFAVSYLNFDVNSFKVGTQKRICHGSQKEKASLDTCLECINIPQLSCKSLLQKKIEQRLNYSSNERDGSHLNNSVDRCTSYVDLLNSFNRKYKMGE